MDVSKRGQLFSLSKVELLCLLCGALIVCYLSKDVYLLNTGDFSRIIKHIIIESIPTQIFPLSLNYTLRGIDSMHPAYPSSYAFFVYFYALFLSFFTTNFDVRLLSSLLKIAYVFVVYFFIRPWLPRPWQFRLLCIAFTFFMLFSSSILSFFSSFYQEQVILVFIPVSLMILFHNRFFCWEKFVFFVSVTVVCTAKTQYFYIPVIYSFVLYHFLGYKKIDLYALMLLALSLGFLCILCSSASTKLNQYHSLYFGSYILNKSDSFGSDCVGVDAWGNKFDFTRGAIKTDAGQQCFKNNLDVVSFRRNMEVIASEPSSFLLLPFSSFIGLYSSENYFHVYFDQKIINQGNVFLERLTIIKDSLYSGLRFFVCICALLLSIFCKRSNMAGLFFLLSSFGVSQFYVAFLGEGFRDLAKHLFAMNFCTDLMLVAAVVSCCELIVESLYLERLKFLLKRFGCKKILQG